MEKRSEARRAGAQRTRMRRKRRQNKSAVLYIALISLMLLGVMSVQILSLYGRKQSYQMKEQELQTQLESEQQRQAGAVRQTDRKAAYRSLCRVAPSQGRAAKFRSV